MLIYHHGCVTVACRRVLLSPTRVGVCGICRPGQLPVPAAAGDLLVPVLSSLLLLLRELLLLPRHLLLSPAPSVPPARTALPRSPPNGGVIVFLSFVVYEAGKMAKRGAPAQVPVYPYYIPGVPAVVPLAPSSHVEPKITSIPSVETNLAGGERLSLGLTFISSIVLHLQVRL